MQLNEQWLEVAAKELVDFSFRQLFMKEIVLSRCLFTFSRRLHLTPLKLIAPSQYTWGAWCHGDRR